MQRNGPVIFSVGNKKTNSGEVEVIVFQDEKDPSNERTKQGNGICKRAFRTVSDVRKFHEAINADSLMEESEELFGKRKGTICGRF